VAQAATPPMPPTKAPLRLGVFFWHDSPNDRAAFEGIQQGMRDAQLAPQWLLRRADADQAKATAMIADLRAQHCDLVFAMGTQAALLLQQGLPDTTIVFAAVSNPIASGVLSDWQGSGTKLCGGSNWVPPASILRVFLQAMPNLKTLGMLRSETSGIVSAAELATMRAYLAAPDAPKVQLLESVAKDPADLPRAVEALRAQGAQAIWIPIDLGIYKQVAAIHAALGSHQLPLLSTAVQAAREGAMVTVSVDYVLHGRRVAALAERVLRGADPGKQPVDLLQGWQVTADLGAARRAGHELPLSLLALADVLIPEATDDQRKPAK
jgi:putative ABC transport system substrate-binding protein